MVPVRHWPRLRQRQFLVQVGRCIPLHIYRRWLFAMFTTSTPAALSATNDSAGERKWTALPATGSPRSVIAVSRLTIAKPATEDEEPVEAHWADGAHEALSVGVGPRRTDRWFDHPDTFPAKHLIQAGSELRVGGRR